MTDLDLKQNQQAEWLKQHTLSQDQFKQLIANKMRRAADMQQAIRKREALQKHR